MDFLSVLTYDVFITRLYIKLFNDVPRHHNMDDLVRRIHIYGGYYNVYSVFNYIKYSINEYDTRIYRRTLDNLGRLSYSIKNRRLNIQVIIGYDGTLITLFQNRDTRIFGYYTDVTYSPEGVDIKYRFRIL